MIDISFYTKSQITLKDLALIAEKGGYDYSLTSLEGEKRLNVFFKYKRDGRNEESYCRWFNSSEATSNRSDPEDFGDFEWESLNKLNPASTFEIGVYVYMLPHLVELLKMIMKQYGGWVSAYAENRWYTLQDIDDLTNLYPDMEKGEI